MHKIIQKCKNKHHELVIVSEYLSTFTFAFTVIMIMIADSSKKW